jgi:enterobactin synthetase component D
MLGCRFTASTYQDDLFAKLQIRCPGRIQTAVPRRKAEFLAGRYLCRRLLEPGGSTDDIPSGHHGQPLWPPGWIGSISHSSDLAIGAIAPTAQMGLLGIDAEPWLEEGIANQIVRTVLDVHEECLLREVWPLGRSLTLAFSAKESFFKAVYPRVGHYFDFDCVQLTGVDLEMGNLTFKVTSQLSAALGAYPEFTVHFNQTAHGVITLAWA